MIIKDILLYKQNIPLKTPFKTALRQVKELSSIIVEIITDTANLGYGAASPTAAITGETVPSIICAINDYIKPAIINKKLDISLNKNISLAIAHNTSAKAAAEMALYDLLAQEEGLPLFKYLGGKQEKQLENDITISLNSPQIMKKDTEKAIKCGIEILKIKLGGTCQEDIQRIDAVTSVSGNCKLRLDANQAWDFASAKTIIEHCTEKGYNIELIEQPFAYNQLELMKKLKDISTIPILADESVFSVLDAKKTASLGCADYINIKLAKCGGITEAVKINSVAESAGIKCLMGCMLESPIGIIAAAHFAAAFENITMYDLDAVELLKYNPVISATEFTPRYIYVKNSGTGLGITDIGKAEKI